MYHCFNCHASWESTLRQPAVKETCASCGAYLHCCKNCTYHRKGYPNECYIPDTEKVADKSRANFCDEFEFVSEATLAKRKGGRKPAAQALAELFGDEVDSNQPGEEVKDWLASSDKPKQDLDDLFDE